MRDDADASGTVLSILVVEDDASLRQVLGTVLAAQGWNVTCLPDGQGAVSVCRSRHIDLVTLDVMLPGISGIDLCVALRELQPTPGVLMITARGAEADVVLGLDAGADDYVVKPCRPREIVARIRALARRIGRGGSSESIPAPPRTRLEFGPLVIDPSKRRVVVGDTPLRLTPSEYELLRTMADEPERVFTRMELLDMVFGTQFEGYARNVDCHVARLRRKLERAGIDPAPIVTNHGVGYCFRPKPLDRA